MSRVRNCGLFVAVLCCLAVGALAEGPPERRFAEPRPFTESLAGQLLVASPETGDPRFHATVILLLRHDAEGAMGLIVNRPVQRQPAARLLQEFGVEGEAASGDILLHFGGPVQPGALFVLHSPDYRVDGTLAVGKSFAMTSRSEILRDVAAAKGPKQCLFALGYAGWGPGQLEGELGLEAWTVVPADPELVFDADAATKWERAMKRRGIDL